MEDSDAVASDLADGENEGEPESPDSTSDGNVSENASDTVEPETAADEDDFETDGKIG